MKYKEVTDDLYFSFEYFMFSNLTKIITNNKKCQVCNISTSIAFIYKNITFYAHSECLSLHFFHQFFNLINESQNKGINDTQLDSSLGSSRSNRGLVPSTNSVNEITLNGKQNDSNLNTSGDSKTKNTQNGLCTDEKRYGKVSLHILYDAKISMEGEEKICYSCGGTDVYFKCLVKNCKNYMHFNCSGNGYIIIYSNYSQFNPQYMTNGSESGLTSRQMQNSKEKLISYRFLLCYNHVKNEIIAHIKQLFLNQLYNITEFNVQNHIHKPTIKPATNKKQNKFNAVSVQSTTTSSFAPGSSPVTGSAPHPPRPHPVGLSTNVAINNIIYEYNIYKKSNIIKNNKPININHFNILFIPIYTHRNTNTQTTQILNSNISNTSDSYTSNKHLSSAHGAPYTPQPEECYSDIIEDLKSLLNAENGSMLNVNELKKLVINSEYGLQNIVNVIRQLLYPNTAPKLPPQYSGTNTLLEDKIYNLVYKKPKFVLLKLYNKYIWMSIIKLYNNKYKFEKHVILHYLSISQMEYIYLKYIVNSIYFFNTHTLNPINGLNGDNITNGSGVSTTNPANRSGSNSNILFMYTRKSENDTIHEDMEEEGNSRIVSLYGYNWSINPSAGLGTDDTEDEDENSEIHENGFVERQITCIVRSLKLIKNEIEKHKVAMNERISNEKYKSLIYNKAETNYYINLSNVLFHYNKFLFSIKKLILHYNNVGLDEDEELDRLKAFDGRSDPGDSSDNLDGSDRRGSDVLDESVKLNYNDNINLEYCSVCLLSELSHKNILLQCQKCFIRVHYNCYNPTVNNSNNSVSNNNTSCIPSYGSVGAPTNDNTNNQVGESVFFCDPCLMERKFENNYNTAICVSCLSSGGAMKIIYVNNNAKYIHLVCLAFIMPSVTYNFQTNHFSLTSTSSFTNMKVCSICNVLGGIQIQCCSTQGLYQPDFDSTQPDNSPNQTYTELNGVDNLRPTKESKAENKMELDQKLDGLGEMKIAEVRFNEGGTAEKCDMSFHPMCCLLSGCYIKYSNLNNINMYKLNNTINTNLLQYLMLKPFCIKHTTQSFTNKFLNEQCVKRSYAYTHYMYHPDGFKSKKNYLSLPIEPIYSPVTITKNGPIKSQPKLISNNIYNYELMNKKMKYNEPYLISVIYGLPRGLSGDVSKYGIYSITQYLTNSLTEDEQYRWLFLYLTLTDKQRIELHSTINNNYGKPFKVNVNPKFRVTYIDYYKKCKNISNSIIDTYEKILNRFENDKIEYESYDKVQGNYNLYINKENLLNVLIQLKKRFNVPNIRPIWNKIGISVKLRVILDPLPSYDAEFNDKEGIINKETYSNDEPSVLQENPDQLLNEDVTEKVKKLAREKKYDANFVITDGTLNSCYRKLVQLRNSFYKDVIRNIEVGEKIKETFLDRLKTQPQYFQNEDQPNVKNSPRFIKYLNILKYKLNQNFITSRNRYYILFEATHDFPNGTYLTVSGGIFPGKPKSPKTSPIPAKKNSKRWNMARLKRCIIDDPPILPYCTFNNVGTETEGDKADEDGPDISGPDYRSYSDIVDGSKYEVVIVGGGVGGLAAFNYLKSKNVNVVCLEARNRIGGRTFTTYFNKNVNNSGEQINVDLGPNYLHCNNYIIKNSKNDKTQISFNYKNDTSFNSQVTDSPNPDQNEIENTVSLVHEVYNPYKDIRNKRKYNKSILGVTNYIKPLVGDLSGYSNWEPTVYTNWYNHKNGNKINFGSVAKTNFIVDKIIVHSNQLFHQLHDNHSFFKKYIYKGVNDNLLTDGSSNGKEQVEVIEPENYVDSQTLIADSDNKEWYVKEVENNKVLEMNEIKSLWDVYYTVYRNIIEEFKRNNITISKEEQSLLFNIIQSRLGYNSDLRETCISMCKLPISISHNSHVVSSSLQNLDPSQTNLLKRLNKDDPLVNSVCDDNCSSTTSTTANCSSFSVSPNETTTIQCNEDTGLDKSSLDLYKKRIKLVYNRLTTLNIEKFQGNSDSDKLVIDGWEWLFRYLVGNDKKFIYLNTLVTQIELRKDNVGDLKREEKIVDSLESEGYDVKLVLKNSDNVVESSSMIGTAINQDTKCVYSKYVIMTVPINLLNEISFEPKLSESRVKSMSNYSMGYHNKIVMRFKPSDIFWPRNEMQFNSLDHRFQFLNLHCYGKKGCILAHSFPPFSKNFDKMSKASLLKLCLKLLHRIFNVKRKVYPVEAFVTNWKGDRYSKGSYSYPKVSANDEDIIHLKSPYPTDDPKILFSDGTFDTSIRAAEDIYNIGLNKNVADKSCKSDSVDVIGDEVKRNLKKEIEDNENMEYSLDNILNNRYSDNYVGIPIPLPSRNLLGYYLTDGSDELISDDNMYLDNSILNDYYTNYNLVEGKSLDFNSNYKKINNDSVCGQTEVFNFLSSDTDISSCDGSEQVDENQMCKRVCKQNLEEYELELLLIIKLMFSESEISIGKMLSNYDKINKIKTHLQNGNYNNKYIYYSKVIIEALLYTTYYMEYGTVGEKECDTRKNVDTNIAEVVEGLEKRSEKEVEMRNQNFSTEMLKNTCKLLGLWYDFLCYYCQRGGEVLLCDSLSCSKIWHYNCIPEEFRPDNVAGAESEREKWLCPICKKCKIEVRENNINNKIF
ncbi:amine oxidase (flavin-containing) [Theileria annulata]|uniref:Amine oxidase (Flavin-containing) n=1 Tax=Theileria annulata TaxID=5874 RepID=Q4UHR1_THEAN|nr:amine oxidase (flavin-containing) [Theileria annulata]CAI73378.1 amine oxidase (flavin-containing) [Theileria annulata]|eukprot:XP_954055.1 amine oxidase (flavin-containing) [Theileria annulata]